MTRTKVNTQKDYPPAPSVILTGKVGNKVLGILRKKVESSAYPGNYSYLIEAKETNAPTLLYDKDTEKSQDVAIDMGDSVWLKGTSVLNEAFKQIPDDAMVEVIYLGKGKAKKGRKPPFLFDVFLHDGEV